MAERSKRLDRHDRPDRPDVASDDPALAIAARHALHDEELIAAYATDGDGAEDPGRARSLIERCQACRELYADITAIGATLRSIPGAQAVPDWLRAPRDYRLSVETANRLRPGSVVLRLRDRLRAAIDSLGRPVGMSMASLGLVGLFLGMLALNGSAGLNRSPEDASGSGGIGGAGAANASAGPGAPGATAEAQLETRGTGGFGGAPGSPDETARLSFDALGTTLATTAPRATAASPVPVVGGPDSGPLAGASLSLAALVVVGSVVVLLGGVALLVAGSRPREPSPGR